MGLFFNLFILILIISKFRAILTNEDNLNITEYAVNTESDAILYLKRFGYLQNFDNNSLTNEQFYNALSEFQKFFRISISGIFDERTKDVMNRPRCGLPDIRHSNKLTPKRVKRFALNGKKWKLNELTWKWMDIPDRNQLNESQAFETFLSNNLIDLFKNMTDVWQRVCNLRFKYSPNDAEVNIVVNFAKINGTDNKRVDVKWLSISKALISFDYEEWSVDNFMSVGVHSIGHVLGLKHSQLNQSVMSPFAYITPFQSLSHDDIVAVQTLYDVNPNKPDEQYFALNPNRADWSNDVPDLCSDPKIDAITELSNGVVLVFKGNHYFELQAIGIKRNSPRKIDWDYSGVIGPIDAVMESNEHIFIFKGHNYWKFSNKTAVKVNRPITEEFVGIPTQTSIDAAFKSHKNGKTYLFSGQQFWEYDTENRLTEANPKKISSQWRGIPDSIDAAFSSTKRMQTYFFKQHVFYRFDDNSETIAANVNPHYPRRIDIEILRCRNMIETKQPITPTTKLLTTDATTRQTVISASNAVRNLTIILAILLIVFNATTIVVVWMLRQQNIKRRTQSEERDSGDEPEPEPEEEIEMSRITPKQQSRPQPQHTPPSSSSSTATSKSSKSGRSTTTEEDVGDIVKIDVRKKAPLAKPEESESD